MATRTVQRTPNLGLALKMRKTPAPVETVEQAAPCQPSIDGVGWYNAETDAYDLAAVTGIVREVDMTCTPP